ncbi:MAG: bifunctional 4-hydroxy-3-methylbut-2-enyl diphosphate reductase/30S ribosomal protein S1 [Tissierellia bacterium]|nr:bifunctional 4-hydroxy-3-methylbut-2-enyl diphosphate reductase/30S ribosomal protein S1 [Tissierellia bacterium]
MNIYIAKHAGYCFGVKNAVKLTVQALEQADNKPVYSLGPLIHNPQMVDKLRKDGLKILKDPQDLDDGRIIIRAHGIPRDIQCNMEDRNLELIDATCPFVKAVHRKVDRYYKLGYKIIIVGDENHPEVIGINGWCNYEGIIVASEEVAHKIGSHDKICIVSQTTNTLEKFENISSILLNKGIEVKIFNTICNATNLRQKSCKELAEKVDAMIVIGGYNSSNTNKLAQISEQYCKNVYHIETSKELPLQQMKKFNTIGITAGASTPGWIIKEVVNIMNGINDNEIMEAIENSLVNINRGDIVDGKVIYVTEEEVMVNINYKSDGIIKREELSNDPHIRPKDLFNEGDEIEVYVINLDDGEGNVVLSVKRLETIKNWEELEKSYEDGETIECKVLTEVRGGLSVSVKNIRGFMPASQISLKYVDDLSVYKDKVLTARIIDLDRDRRRIILSSRVIEQEKLEKQREALWDSLEIDSIIDGQVARLTDFGAFVDIGGLDGLIHISDLSWARIGHPSEVVKQGDKIQVKVLNCDRERNRISLGLKQILPKPWDLFIENREISDITTGRVVNILDFGAFVRLEEGIDGLVHISQISKDHVKKPSDKLEIGQEVTVKIIDIDEENQRISLSMREVEDSIDGYEEDSIDPDIENNMEDHLDE